MNKNAPMVQEYVLGAAAPHFYYPPGTRLIEEIWYDTDDEEEDYLNESFHDALISAEIVSQLMPTEGRIKKASRLPGPAKKGPPERYENRSTGSSRLPGPGRPTPPPSAVNPRMAAYTHTGTPTTTPRRTMFPGGQEQPVINPSPSYLGAQRMRQAALNQGLSPEQASEMGDSAYYQLRSAEDRIGRNRAGRAALTLGLMGAAGLAPESLFPNNTKWGKAARIGTILGVAGMETLAESGLPDGVIRSYIKKARGVDNKTLAMRTDNAMRRYGGVAHTPERDLLELAAQKTPPAGQARDAMIDRRKNLAREHALKALDVPDDVRQLYAAMKSTPPSKGYITSSQTGRVLAHATGNTADYFVPFTMKQMYGRGKQVRDKKGNYDPGTSVKGGLRGNDYIRSRSKGGMTPEDVRTALLFGARKAEVISPDGAEWIKFTDKAQSSKSLIPGKNIHIHRIPRQYREVKAAINNNQALTNIYNTPQKRHDAAVAYLAWKNPKYIEGPVSTASPAPMKGTKPEKTPYVTPKSVSNSAQYSDVRKKINASIGGTKLPEKMSPYAGPTKGRTSRQRAAAKAGPVVKPGIDHARKLGAAGAITALRAGTAEDKAQAKKIIRSSGLYDKETGKFLTAQQRRARRAQGQAPRNETPQQKWERERKERQQGKQQSNQQQGNKPSPKSLNPNQTEAQATASAVQHVNVWQHDLDAANAEAIRRMTELDDDELLKKYANAGDFTKDLRTRTKQMFEAGKIGSGAGPGRKVDDRELDAYEAHGADLYDKIRQRVMERKDTAGNKEGIKFAGVPAAEIQRRTADMLDEMAGGKGPRFDTDTAAGRSEFAAYAARQIMQQSGSNLGIEKATKGEINGLLNEVVRGTRSYFQDAPEPDEHEIGEVKRHYVRSEAEERAGRQGRDTDWMKQARDTYSQILSGEDYGIDEEF